MSVYEEIWSHAFSQALCESEWLTSPEKPSCEKGKSKRHKVISVARGLGWKQRPTTARNQGCLGVRGVFQHWAVIIVL